MSDDYGDVPGIQIATSEDELTLGPSGHRYVHIDDFESHDDPGVKLHLYAFDEEDRRDELIDTIQDLRQDFIFATGIIWPDEIREEVEQADTFRMRALEWTCVTMQYTGSQNDD